MRLEAVAALAVRIAAVPIQKRPLRERSLRDAEESKEVASYRKRQMIGNEVSRITSFHYTPLQVLRSSWPLSDYRWSSAMGRPDYATDTWDYGACVEKGDEPDFNVLRISQVSRASIGRP